MKLFTVLGPGDIVSAHRLQMCGEKVDNHTSIIFSGQLLEYCRLRGIKTLALSYNGRTDSLCDRDLHIENRPRSLEGGGKIRFHLARLTYAVYLAVRARRFGADLALIDSGSTHYFALALFPLLGIPVAVNFHNSLWPNGLGPEGLSARLINYLNAWYFRRLAVATMGVSPEIGIQLEHLVGRTVPYFEYRAQFRIEGFTFNRRDHDQKPFRVVFVGRTEYDKGVLDIPTMAEMLVNQCNIPIVFDICGDGSALAELKNTVKRKYLCDHIRIHGQLNRSQLLQVYDGAHAVIVPSHVSEGLPQVCAEAVLCGLPIITSRLSNLLAYRPVVATAEPNNVNSYVKAIKVLAEDSVTYNRLHDSCRDTARQFLDRSQSYPAAIDRLIAYIFSDWEVLETYDEIMERVA
jgi:glycogen synthase